MKQVTVSIATYVALPSARLCLKALMMQKGVDFDVILTANGSPPAAAFFREVAATYPDQIRFVENEENEGFIAPNVKALSMTSTPFFLMLNDDTQLPPNGLELLLKPFADDEKTALVGVMGGCSELDANFEGKYGPALEYVEGACLMCRTDLVKKHGLFDPMLHFAYCEDSDLSLRMRELGYTVGRVVMDIQHKRGATARYVPGIYDVRMANQQYCAKKWALYLKTRKFDPANPPATLPAPAPSPVPVTAAAPVPVSTNTVPLTVVTCTGDRPEAFALAERWMARQTVQPIQWLVLDDGKVSTVCTQGQEYYSDAKWRGRNSMVDKIKFILEKNLVTGDGLVFWEDDDWYAPTWLEFVWNSLKIADIVGEGRAIYYNVKYRWWHEHGNMDHASLCETAVGRKFYPRLKELFNTSMDPFIDNRIWRENRFKKHLVDPTNPNRRLSVGIKAMPGRMGYGSGHNKPERSSKMDPSLIKLRGLLGDEAYAYANYEAPSRVPPK